MASGYSRSAEFRYRVDKFLDRYPPVQKVVYFLRSLTIDRGRRSDYLFDSIRMAFSTVFPERRFDYFVSPDGQTAGVRDRELVVSLTINKGRLTDYKLFEGDQLIGRFPLMERVLFSAVGRFQQLVLSGEGGQATDGKVILFALPRTGSNALASILNLHPELHISLEPFNPSYSEWGDANLLSQLTDKWTFQWALERLFTESNGFKHLVNQLPWLLNQQLLERPCRRIFLYRRDIFSAALSQQIVAHTQEVLNRRAALNGKTSFPEVGPTVLRKEMARIRNTYTSYREFVEIEELDFFEVAYEQLFNAPEEQQWSLLERLFDYLGVSQPDSELRTQMSRYLAQDEGKFVRGEELYRRVLNYPNLLETFQTPEERSWDPASVKRTLDRPCDLNIVKGQPLGTSYVFVLCFRNQADKIERCLNSILQQEGSYNWGVAIVDDASNDASLEIVLSLLSETTVPHVVVSNNDRRFYSRNLFNAVHHLVLDSESVIIEVDGDDYLAGPNVLHRLDRAYGSGAARTMGSFRVDRSAFYFFGEPKTDFTQPWDFDMCTSWMHLKTYKKWLFQQVPLPYFKERGSDRWLKMGEDMVIHPKMIEMAGTRNRYINDVLYVYDYSGANHDCKEPSQALYKLQKLYRLPRGEYLRQLRRELEGSVYDKKLKQTEGEFAWLYD